MNKSKTYELLLTDFFPDAYFNITHSPNPKLIFGSEGKYKVSFTLNKPNSPLFSETERKHSDLSMGESHLKMSEPDEFSVTLKNHENSLTETINIEILLNEEKCVGKIVCSEVQGVNFEDAKIKAYRAVAMFLSHYSLYLDIPLNIYQVDVIELKTNISRIELLAPHFELQINGELNFESDSPELCNFASYYREALSSNSVAYKFLCYFKIIEGINEMRNRINGERRSLGLEPFRPTIAETIPNTSSEQVEFVKKLFPFEPPWTKTKLALDTVFVDEAKGKRVSSLYANKLNDIRVQISHGLTKKGERTISLDEALNLNEIIKWLPLTRIIVRLLIKNQFADFMPT